MRHIILKQLIEITTGHAGDGFSMPQRFSNFYNEEILPALATIFDDCAREDEVIRFEKLIIDLGNLTEDSLAKSQTIQDLMLIMTRQVKDQLRNVVSRSTAPTSKVRRNLHAFDHWIFYMNHGAIKWNAMMDPDAWETDVLQAVATQERCVNVLRQAIVSNEHALTRIAIQHNDAFKRNLLEALTATSQATISAYVNELAAFIRHLSTQANITQYHLTPTDTFALWKIILLKVAQEPTHIWSSERIVAAILNDLISLKGQAAYAQFAYAAENTTLFANLSTIIREINLNSEISSDDQISSPALPKPSSPPDEDSEKAIDSPQDPLHTIESLLQLKPTSNQPTQLSNAEDGAELIQLLDEEGLFLSHAGLVLLHPFLHAFFKELDIVRDNKFINTTAAQHATMLLHYMTAGDQPAAEFDLLIPKLLCGREFKEAIDTTWTLPDFEKTAADELLNEVVHHWSILQNTSPNGLREGFLQRRGKYSLRNNLPLVQVENSSIDMLLDHLPWPLSPIKLPWMKSMLTVEWR